MPTPDIVDTRLVASALSGNQGAVEELIARYQHKAFAIALAAGVRRDSVPDVLQDAFVRAFRALPELETYGSYGSWFLTIVRNVARRSLREAPRGASSEDLDRLADRSSESHADTIERSDFNERLRHEVDRLPEGIREAIFLYYYEGESVRRVASALGTTAPAVKNRLQKGRDLLRDRLWRELRDSLRDMLPSARESRRAARHLSLVVLTSLPAAWGTTAGAASGAPSAGTGTEAAAGLSAPLQGIAIMSAKQVTSSVIACVVLFWLGFAGGYRDGMSAPPAPAPEPVAAVAHPQRAIAPARVAPAPEPAAAAAAPVEPPPEPTPEPPRLGAVRAHVAREIDDGPVVGAIVVVRHRDSSPRLEEFLGVTDERGVAEIGDIPPGEVEVLSDRAAPRDRRRSLTRIAPGETAEVLLRLRQGITVDGIVVDAASVPVAGAEVRVSEAEFDGLHGHTVARSGPDGTFRIEGIERGRYMSARAEGRAPSSQHTVSGEPGSNLSLQFVLPGAGGTVTGRVADGSGAAVSGALVVVGSRAIWHGAFTVRCAPVVTRTDADGAFEAHGIPPGATPVAARARGFGPVEVNVDVAAAGTSRVALTLPHAAAIEGTVLRPDGAAAPAAVVVAGAGEKENPLAPDDLLVTRTRTDERGRYRLEGLAAGTIAVDVSAKGLGKTRRTVDAAPGDVVALDVMLPGSLEIAGRVVLEDGTPVEGWSVHGSDLTLQFTDAEGRFTFRDVDDRAYTIEVDERGHHVPCARVEGVRAGGDAVTITVLEADRSRSFASGIVVDPDGRRVRGARVGCFRPDGSTVTSAKTDFFGGFRIGPLPAGTYLLGASTDDLPRVWADDLTVAHGETLSIGEIRLRRPGFLELAFRSRSGRTAEGLAIHVRDAAGRHVLRRALPLPSQSQPFLPGRHTVTVQGSGFELVREVEIREGERTTVEIDLDDVR